MTNVLSIDVGKANYALCAADIDTSHVLVKRLECWRLGDTKAMPASQLIDTLVQNFQEWDLLQEFTPNVVLIEQQIRGAHINLALAFATYTYMKTRFPTAIVKFVRPANKFKAFATFVTLSQEDQVILNMSSKATSDYVKRKRLAVKLTEIILQKTQQPDLQTLCPGAKKDDLADAFLQAFCF